MRHSDTLSELAKALAAAQSEAENASKDATNPHFNRTYATLKSALDAIRGPFTKNGLSFVQLTETPTTGPVILTTRLLHTSGEWLEGDYPIQPVKNDPQGFGSALTYARRYTIMALAGIAPEDDDGNAGSELAAAAYVAPTRRKGGQAQGVEAPPPPPEPEVNAMSAEALRQAFEGAPTLAELNDIVKRNAPKIRALEKQFPAEHKEMMAAATKRKEQLTTKEGTAA